MTVDVWAPDEGEGVGMVRITVEGSSPLTPTEARAVARRLDDAADSIDDSASEGWRHAIRMTQRGAAGIALAVHRGLTTEIEARHFLRHNPEVAASILAEVDAVLTAAERVR